MIQNLFNTYIIQDKGRMGKFVKAFLGKIKYFVFSALNVISHCFDHEFRVSRSLFNSRKSFTGLSISLMSAVSLANNLMLLRILYFTSFTQIKNSKGPRIEPQLIQIDWVKFCHLALLFEIGQLGNFPTVKSKCQLYEIA